MENELQRLLDHIGESYMEMIDADSEHYMEVNLGKTAQATGFKVLQEHYRDAYVVIPLKEPVAGMKVRIDGRTFVQYCRHPKGFVVPCYIAKAAGIPWDQYEPNDSMILNFS